jgi:ribonuclease J
MANNDHKQVRIKPGDTVILSARVIPGNEKDISRVINGLLRKGARVLHDRIAPVHVSGHASQEEQKMMIEWTRPQFFIPVHGEYRQLVAHAAVAREAGLAPEQIFVIEDGATLSLDADRCVQSAAVPAEKIYIDGKGVGDVEEPTLKDRRRLGSDGVIVVTLAMGKKKGEIKSGPHFLSRGFKELAPADPLWEEMERSLQALFPDEGEAALEETEIDARIRRTLKKLISKKINRYPVIIPNIILM